MPEMEFTIHWPDGSRLAYYSPSLVVNEHLEAGSAYAVPEFVARCRTALSIASDRVREKYGFACPRAAHTLVLIETKAREFAGAADARVLVEDPHRDPATAHPAMGGEVR